MQFRHGDTTCTILICMYVDSFSDRCSCDTSKLCLEARQLPAWSHGTIVPEAESYLLQEGTIRRHNRASLEATDSKLQMKWDRLERVGCWSDELRRSCALQELRLHHASTTPSFDYAMFTPSINYTIHRLHHPLTTPLTTPSMIAPSIDYTNNSNNNKVYSLITHYLHWRLLSTCDLP